MPIPTAPEKGDASEALGLALHEKVVQNAPTPYYKIVTSFILTLLLWCSGFSIITFIAARRKTLTGEECKFSFAEKN